MLFIDTKQISTDFDQHGINEMTVAIGLEMLPSGGTRQADRDTLFMGGGPKTDADRRALGRFGQDKNYKLVLPAFDPADPAAGPVDFDVVVTDGVADTKILLGGRLWKRDRRSASVLLFAELGIVISLSTKGFMVPRAMKGSYADAGYALARDAVAARAVRKPGKVPVFTTVGAARVVLDLDAWFDWCKSGQ